MNTPEQKLNKWIIDACNNAKMHICRIENSVLSGMPDFTIALGEMEIWLESKALTSKKLVIRPAQYAWMVKRSTKGGICMVVWRKNKSWFLYVIDENTRVSTSSKGVVVEDIPSAMGITSGEFAQELSYLAGSVWKGHR
jgi:hypothetical protein